MLWLTRLSVLPLLQTRRPQCQLPPIKIASNNRMYLRALQEITSWRCLSKVFSTLRGNHKRRQNLIDVVNLGSKSKHVFWSDEQSQDTAVNQQNSSIDYFVKDNVPVCHSSKNDCQFITDAVTLESGCLIGILQYRFCNVLIGRPQFSTVYVSVIFPLPGGKMDTETRSSSREFGSSQFVPFIVKFILYNFAFQSRVVVEIVSVNIFLQRTWRLILT